MAAISQSSMGFVLAFLVASALPMSVSAIRADSRQHGTAVAEADASNAANPIRKVVTLLQKMQKEVTEEGEKEKELYDKFMCYCKTSGSDLSAAIEAANTKIPALGSDIEKSEAKLAQTKEDLATAQNDRAAAKTAMAEATSLREKEAASFAAEKAELDANIGATTKAVQALEKGMAGAFLQTGGADLLRKLVLKQDMMEEDRQQILAFISGKQDTEYTPSSGQVTGILKDMGDQFSASLKDATNAENEAIKSYGELMSAKTKEVNALSAAIEAKSKQIGELSVSIAMMKNDLTDTEQALLADKEFLAGLDTSCKTKTSEWEVRVQTRSDELATLADAIKVLNDDDALELFKKTLPSASSSFVQVEARSAVLRAKAMAFLTAATKKAPTDHLRVDFIALALNGKQQGFAKVIGMIDTLVKILKEEQLNDDNKKEYCANQLDFTDDRKKTLERTVSDESAAIASTEEAISTTSDEIATLQAGIKELDKSVAEATANRKAEHEEFSAMMASNSAAKELLGLVKNRLNKFYNPKLYAAPAKRELSAEDRIVVSEGGTLAPTAAPGGIAGTGITVFLEVAHTSVHKAAPPPPPATYGAYAKKSGETSGVMKLMDMLISDLDKEMTEGETEEEDAQKDYEAMMKSSAQKRAADSKVLTEKTASKASLEGDLEDHKEGHKAASKELAATLQYIHELHVECDWLMKYFDVRKEARDSEIDALGNAKAVLSGADYSLLQARSFLGRRL